VRAPGRPAVPRRPALLEQLLGAVRPEFRAEVLVFAAEDPVFGGGTCRVESCPRAARSKGMCPGHHLRWVREGRPDPGVFAATTDLRWHRQRPNASCRVTGCGYGTARGGMCQLHGQRWDRAGQPDLHGWLADPPTIKTPQSGVVCAVEHCDLWPQAALPLCHAHANTWKVNGRPEIDVFVRRFDEVTVTAEEIIRLDLLGPQLRLEIQYVLQCRHDQRATKTLPAVVMALVRALAVTGAVSLLDRTEDDWRTGIGRPAPRDSNLRALLIDARRKVCDLADGDGWEAEFDRDVWQMRRLGFDGNQQLDFTALPQPWLRGLVKRWLRWRLGAGLGLEAARRGLRCMTRFALFCERIGVGALADLDRVVLERYLADLHAELAGRQRHGDQIGQLNSFLHAVRQHHWDDTLPATALVFTEDYPARVERAPRALAEQVMAQIEHPDNLARFTNPAYRLVTLVLIRAGLRVTDALSVSRDCVVLDADGAPYLRYLNHKMKREALVPIDEELNTLIVEQQGRVGDAPVLFPRPTKNPDGRASTASSTYRLALYRWLARCDVRDAHGRPGPADPAPVAPHPRHPVDQPRRPAGSGTTHPRSRLPADDRALRPAARHHRPPTLGSRPQGRHHRRGRHDRPRRAAGRGRLGQAARRATQALPNGFCGLPVQKTCPHANACLTCPMFVTTAEFLPQHRTHRAQVIELITAAQARGQTRLAEMNQQVLGNLDRIIDTLDETPVGIEASDAG
jgi:integrase